MNRVPVMVLAVALLEAGISRAAGPTPRDPDWPCQQIRVPELSLAAIWTGPAVDLQSTGWSSDKDVADLVQRVAPRRVPIETAQQLIHDFAVRAGEQRQQRLLAILTGLFRTLNQERESVIAGLDRFGRRQKELASEFRADNEKLRVMQTDAATEASAVEQQTQRVTWEAQVFQDRRLALGYACDVPSKIEQRLFALARAIQQEMQQ
jgi:hypothetical protein